MLIDPKINMSINKLNLMLFFGLIGVCVGFYAWGNSADVGRLGLLLLLPLFWGLASSRLYASALVIGYFLASARGLPAGAAVFFGNGAPVWVGFVFWVVACVLLSLPFIALWSSSTLVRPWRFVIAVCVSILPPLGLIGWVNPISTAGVYFPNVGWLGLILTLGVMAALVARHGKWIVVFGGISLLANLVFSASSNVKVPTDWRGVDTHFSGVSSAGSEDAGRILASMARIAWIKGYVESIPARSVRVLPETLLGSFSGVADYSLMGVNEKLAKRGSRLLVGAEMPQADGRYLNGLMVMGSGEHEMSFMAQGVPVPVSMWKPWTGGGAVANIFGGGSIKVENVRAGVLVCYEQLLSFSVLKVMLSRPEVLVGVANVWWVKDPSIPAIQGQMLNVFGRLFAVPVIRAVNY